MLKVHVYDKSEYFHVSRNIILIYREGGYTTRAYTCRYTEKYTTSILYTQRYKGVGGAFTQYDVVVQVV